MKFSTKTFIWNQLEKCGPEIIKNDYILKIVSAFYRCINRAFFFRSTPILQESSHKTIVIFRKFGTPEKTLSFS